MNTLSNPPSQRWLLAHTLAIAFTLSHVILDWWAGLMAPAGDTLTGSGTLILLFSTGIYALWAYALVLASHGSRWAVWATIGVSALSSFNGFAIVYCWPPCLFPVGDLSHIGSLVFCLWAIFESWRMLKTPQSSIPTVKHTHSQA